MLVREIEGAQWFNKACPSERFAIVLYDSDKKSKNRLYCYRGRGKLDENAAETAGGMVCLCKQWEFAAALHCALKLSMSCCPFGPVSNGDPTLCYTAVDVDTHCLGEGEDQDDDVNSLSPNKSNAVHNFKELCENYYLRCKSKFCMSEPEDDPELFTKHKGDRLWWAKCNQNRFFEWWCHPGRWPEQKFQ